MYSLINAYNMTERLMAAVHSADYEAVLKCLMQGAQATLVSRSSGRTAVGTAALIGDAEILELLIQSCEEPDLDIFKKSQKTGVEMEMDSTPEGMDKLEWEDEFVESQQQPADNEATVKPAEAADEDTSLYFYYAKTFERTGAIVSGIDMETSENNEARKMCIQQDPHTMDTMLMSPLHYAAACGNVDCARILIEHGALIDVINTDGFTPFHLGVKTPEITKLLLECGGNPNMKTFCNGMTPLHYAIAKNLTSANMLMRYPATDVNAMDHIDQTPLMMAVFHDRTEIAKELIALGAHVNVHDNEGNSALKYAVLQNNLQLAALLLSHGARRLPSHHLLHHCVNYNYKHMAELLIRHGESLNVRNKLGHTPIMSAIIGMKAEILEYFLIVQAQEQHNVQLQLTLGCTKPSAMYSRSKNDLQVAVQVLRGIREFRPVARVLFAYSTSAASWITSPEWPESMTSCALVTSCHNIPYCKTPLAFAIITHKYDIAEFLIKEGVDISLVCRDHVVKALRLICTPGYAELARLLVYAGFKYPIHAPPFPYYWNAERLQFEKDMIELCNRPLPLQSLARLCIRKHLVHVLNCSLQAREQYCATREESTLSRMIKALGVPRMLEAYLNEFSDLPTVCSKFVNVRYPTTRNIFDLQLEI